MKATLDLAPQIPSFSIVSAKTLRTLPWRPLQKLKTTRCSQIRASKPVANDPSTVDYSSMTSVFPAEACETIGGEVCDVEMYPEVKLTPEAKSTTASSSTPTEHIDREYFEYDGPKTVFLEEACDDLGGEFCDPEYKRP